MKKIKIALLCLGILTALAACGGYEPKCDLPFALDFDYALEQATQRRNDIEKPDYYALLVLSEGRTPLEGHPMRFVNYWGSLFNFGTEPRLMTFPIRQAIADTWELFDLLRGVYGGYLYFGGDAVFYPAFQAIEAELNAHDGARISNAEFTDLLHRHLSQVIVDNHFHIGGRRLGTDAEYFRISDLRYDRSERGFINRQTGLFLTAIEEHDINSVIRLHADGYGGLYYAPILLAKSSGYGLAVDFVYENNETISRVFYSFYTEPLPFTLPFLEHHDGIPVLSARVFGFDGHENAHFFEHAVRFLAYAEQLRDEPIAIIDLRTNGGGNGLLPVRWFYALTSEIVPSNYIELNTMSHYLLTSAVSDQNNPFQNPPGSHERFRPIMPFGKGYAVSNNEPRTIIEREQLLIVLTDRFTGSAAEDFADMVFNISNTL